MALFLCLFIPKPSPSPWKNCLVWNLSVVPKRLGTTAQTLFGFSIFPLMPVFWSKIWSRILLCTSSSWPIGLHSVTISQSSLIFCTLSLLKRTAHRICRMSYDLGVFDIFSGGAGLVDLGEDFPRGEGVPFPSRYIRGTQHTDWGCFCHCRWCWLCSLAQGSVSCLPVKLLSFPSLLCALFFIFIWMSGPFLKSLLNLLQYCFCFTFWFFLLGGMWDLSSLTRDRTWAPCIGRWSLHHHSGPPEKSPLCALEASRCPAYCQGEGSPAAPPKGRISKTLWTQVKASTMLSKYLGENALQLCKFLIFPQRFANQFNIHGRVLPVTMSTVVSNGDFLLRSVLLHVVVEIP